MADDPNAPSWATATPDAPPSWAITTTPQAPTRPAGATGVLGQLGQTWQDLTDPNHPQHDPNSLESGIMGVTFSKPVQSLQGNFQSAVDNGIFMQPVRAGMEALGIGRQEGESDASLHARYGAALQQARQQAAQQAADNQVGSYGPGSSIPDWAARAAQQVGNVGAGIVANPQYALLPGMGVGGSVAARIGTSALGNAGVGAVSDAAAQLMDIAQGDKKDFDIQQNLTQALAGGAFGAALHGTVEIAPYIKQLFSNRGVDTTPSADPRTSNIQPMTTDHIALNAADHMQLQQLMQTGSVDDIKTFFNGRQGPQPSWASVNRFVEQRDNPDFNGTPKPVANPRADGGQAFNYNDQYNQQAEQQYADTQRQAVQDHVDSQTANWKNAPNVEVVHGPQDIQDPQVRQRALDADGGTALGFYSSDGTVRMYSGRISSPELANALLFHEGLGHHGLSLQFGDKLDSVLQSMLDRNVNQFSKDTDAWMAKNPGAYGGNRIRAAEEVLAERSEAGQAPQSWRDALTSTVKQFGRKMGLKLAYSDAEVNNVLAMSHDAVINGTDPRGNGFSGTKSTENKFMFTGPNATGFDPESPTAYKAKDGVWRNEISDQKARLYDSPGDTLGSTLQHPDLFEQYPELYGLPVKHEKMPGLAGAYDPDTATQPRHMTLNRDSYYDPLDVVLHETQHAIQDIEQYPDFARAVEAGGTSNDPNYSYKNHPSELEARAVERRRGYTEDQRIQNIPKFMRSDSLGREQTDPKELDMVDRLKADPRYWTDPEYRANIAELARTRFPPNGPVNKFMRTIDSSKSDNFDIYHDTDALGKPMLHVVPNERLMPGAYVWDRRQEGLRVEQDKDGQYRVASSSLPERLRGQQLGREMYRLADAEVQRLNGERLASDSTVSDKAGRLWKAAGATRNPEAVPARIGGLKTEDGSPVYSNPVKFMRMPSKEAASTPGYRSDDLERIYHSLDENYTPSKVSWEDNQTAALKAGFSVSQIKDLKATNPGELSTRLYRIQSAANLTDMKLAQLHEKLDTGDFSEKDQADYIKAIADFHYLVARVKGERAEIGRALNVTKAAWSYSNGAMDQMRELLEQNGSGLAGLAADPTAFFKFVRQMKMLMGPQGANGGPPMNANPEGSQTMLNGVNKPYWEQYLTTAHMNMMLLAVSTHVKAPVDMATGIAREVLEKAAAIPYSKARQMFEAMTGRAPTPGVETGELLSHMAGVLRAVSDGEVYRQMWNAAKTGNSSYVIQGEATPTNFANQFGATSNPRIPGVSIPTQLISAQDTFFRSVSINTHLDSLGYREARAQLGSKASMTDIMTLGHTLAMNPLPSMLKEAYDLTNRTLLLNDNPLNNIVNRARIYTPNMTPGQRVGAFFASNLMPFIRVESNSLLNRIIQRTPLGLVDPTGYTQAQLRAGGAKADIAMTKMIYGTVVLGMMWGAADKAKDYLTGDGPGDVNQYKEKIASGWRPNAVHENGQYNTGGNKLGMSINPFDMHNKTAQMVASMREAYDAGANEGNVGNGLLLAFGSLMSNLARQSWASDIDPALSAITSQGQTAKQQVATTATNEVKSWVPNIFGQTARITDSSQRDETAQHSISGTLTHGIQSMIPGAREQLPVKYSVYGQPLEVGASWSGVHVPILGLSGNHTTQTSDPTEMELDRLNASLPDIAKTVSPQDAAQLPKTLVTAVQRTIKIDGIPKQLSPAEFEKYQQLAGVNTVEHVRQEMSTPEWQAMSDYDKVQEVRSIEADMKQSAKEALFGQ
jgi:hypothetical protein